MDYLNRNPYFPKNKSRLKTANLTPKQKELRYRLLRRKSAIDHRRKVLGNNPDRLLIESRMDAEVARLCLEIHKVGGIPPKWLSQLL